jgi:hypothetical protein
MLSQANNGLLESIEEDGASEIKIPPQWLLVLVAFNTARQRAFVAEPVLYTARLRSLFVKRGGPSI